MNLFMERICTFTMTVFYAQIVFIYCSRPSKSDPAGYTQSQVVQEALMPRGGHEPRLCELRCGE
jgi:hypothetical protein